MNGPEQAATPYNPVGLANLRHAALEKAMYEGRKPTTREKLEHEKAIYEEQLEKVNKALKMLDDNPQFEEFHNALQQVT